MRKDRIPRPTRVPKGFRGLAVEVLRGSNGLYYLRFWAWSPRWSRRRVIGDGGEGYATRSSAVRAARTLKRLADTGFTIV